MGLIENFQMAWASIRSNKMRSLLTMLGIIIGIAAVIAIETVGNSMSGYMTDSFSGLGTNNINVVLTHKTADSADGTADGVFLRQFMETRPGKDDLITDQMIREFQAAFPDKVDHVELSTMIGTGTIAKYGNPNNKYLPKWEPLTAEHHYTMVIDRECACLEDHDTELVELVKKAGPKTR